MEAWLHGHPFPASVWAKLYKRELFIEYRKYLNGIQFFGEDMLLNFELFLKANKVMVLEQPLYFYRAGGATSKYMPALFDDMILVYRNQLAIINEYYQENREHHTNGASIMLLNTLKTCLYNLILGKIEKAEAHRVILSYVEDPYIRKCMSNKGCIQYFHSQNLDCFLDAIKNKDIGYLYNFGIHLHSQGKLRRCLFDILSKLG